MVLFIFISMNKIVGVYKITNLINGKCYIGSSRDVTKRWSEHKRQLKNGNHHSEYLQRAYNKYGINNFEYSLLCICSVEDLLINEQKYFDEISPEYIIHKIAGRSIGYKHTDEAKKIIKEKRKLQAPNKCSDETKLKISESNKGRKFTNEHKKKLSDAKRGKKLSQEHKDNLKKRCDSESMRKKQLLSVISRKKNKKPMSDKRKNEISKNNSVSVVAINDDYKIVYDFNSYRDVSTYLNKSMSTLYRIIKNKKKYNNFLWMRKKDYERLFP